MKLVAMYRVVCLDIADASASVLRINGQQAISPHAAMAITMEQVNQAVVIIDTTSTCHLVLILLSRTDLVLFFIDS